MCKRLSKQLKNEKTTGLREVTGEKIRNGVGWGTNCLWGISNRAFKSGIVLGDWKKEVIIPLYKGKGRKEGCMNYKDIN